MTRDGLVGTRTALASTAWPRHEPDMSLIEWIAVAFGVANIVLIIRRNVLNFPVALVMVALYGKIFWDLKLYSDAGLQVFFFVVNIIGWRMWSANEAASGEIQVERLRPRARALWLGGTLGATLMWGAMMHRFTDASLPWADAAIAMMSVAAQILMTRRYLENWLGWIAVNMLSVAVYAAKGIVLTAGLYGLFLIMAGVGLYEWRRHEARI
jgi:nicotinamide mononucleotide transporter